MMDLSAYYTEFKDIYNWGTFAVILALLVVIFLCFRTLKDNSQECNRIWKKALFCVGYILIFAIVLVYYFSGPYMGKKDIDQKTIYSYEGNFEISQISQGIYNKAVFLIDGKEICLKYFEDDGYDFDQIKTGRHEGKLVYAQHIAEVLYIEIDYSE